MAGAGGWRGPGLGGDDGVAEAEPAPESPFSSVTVILLHQMGRRCLNDYVHCTLLYIALDDDTVYKSHFDKHSNELQCKSMNSIIH